MRADSKVSAKEAAHVAGLTPQMLDYLEREGVFEREQARVEMRAKSRHRGSPRRYDFRDLVVLRAITGLLAKGVSVRRLKNALETFCREERFACDRRRMTFDSAPVQYFATDGSEIFFKKDGKELVSILGRGQQAFLFVLDLTEVRTKVQERAPSKAKRRAVRARPV
jgi:DNA-binding transcriptional MerR regulator